MGRKLLWIVLGILVVAFVAYKYVYRPHRDIEKEEASYAFSSEVFIREFREDAAMASEKYVNEVIRINGNITAVEKDHVIVDDNIVARFRETSGKKAGAPISFKGRCVGYDELLEEIRLDECYILNQQ
ncbi:hypothetical protein LS482_01870 [Sinomicrobium kalidii]|uniref:OB-fold protein n=1 Tax=Sinomicrobium kalidii TaxID=2900738 RepID=UPI001E59F1D6|nr:hypothetical protein [Sinomicrobium kalidii]UGU16628.1 hypothetical protein LS482_01870 [Sinomicrobium kalidii]